MGAAGVRCIFMGRGVRVKIDEDDVQDWSRFRDSGVGFLSCRDSILLSI